MTAMRTTVQATVVAVDGRGLLLHGASGSGKSDLALRLIDRGATLIADDLVEIERRGAWLFAVAPARRPGFLFVSGIGVVSVASHMTEARLSMAVHCLAVAPPFERGPVLDKWHFDQLALPDIKLVASEPSAPSKLRLALQRWGL